MIKKQDTSAMKSKKPNMGWGGGWGWGKGMIMKCGGTS